MDDAELLQQFESCALPFKEWTHRCHVKVAYIILSKYPFAEAMSRIKTGIQSYNKFNRVPDEGPLQGYNETTTHALVQIIAAVMQAYRETNPVSNADAFYDMHPELASKHILRLFYSPDRRMHPRAKKQFIEPDLAPLPKILHLSE
jgi:hypothetical protein